MKNLEPCILCNTVGSRAIHQKDRWQYRCCANCSLVSLHPRPTPAKLMKYYRNYLPQRTEDICNWEAMIRPVVDVTADLIVSRTMTGGKKILDVGCGFGFLLKEMKSRGWDVKGLEVSRTGREFTRGKWNVEVYSEPLENLALPAETFDVVSLLYVIEHVYDPLALLRAVHDQLKPGGMVLLRWPHTTPIVRMLGPLSGKLDLYHTPYHLYDFSPKTIERILHKTGFRSVENMIGGRTLPPGRLGRWSSVVSGRLAQTLFSVCGGRVLLPGVSKTTLAFK